MNARKLIDEAESSGYEDLYANFDEPCAVIAFDTRGRMTGPIGYSVRASNLFDAVRQLKAKCDGRLTDQGLPASELDDQAWFKQAASQGLVAVIGKGLMAEAVVSKFNDADLSANEVESLFGFFRKSSQTDKLVLYHNPDLGPAGLTTLGKFARTFRRAVRQFSR